MVPTRSPLLDETGILEDAQLLRHGRLRDVAGSDQIAHLHFTLGEAIQNGAARWIGQRAKDLVPLCETVAHKPIRDF
jgi:hypothetical protein